MICPTTAKTLAADRTDRGKFRIKTETTSGTAGISQMF
jgi:hypothetical protein